MEGKVIKNGPYKRIARLSQLFKCFRIRYQDPYRVVEKYKEFDHSANNDDYWTDQLVLGKGQFRVWDYPLKSYDAQKERYWFKENFRGIPNTNWFECEYYTTVQECWLSDLQPERLKYFPVLVNIRPAKAPDRLAAHRFTVVYEFASGRVMRSTASFALWIAPQ